MWEDLAYFNADLFEGLGRMMLDAAHPSMTSERFQSTYCCHFEVWIVIIIIIIIIVIIIIIIIIIIVIIIRICNYLMTRDI